MATQIQTRRGTTAQHSSFTGAAGEITVDTDKNTVVVHDGSTAGGHAIEAGVNSVNTQTGTVVLDADNIDDTSTTHKFATAAQLTDIGTAVQPGDLAAVATSGAYGDLTGTPTIPTVPVDSVNTQTGAVVLDADDIDDTSTAHKFATAAQLSAADSAIQPGDLATVATSGSYDDLADKPTLVSSIDDLSDVDTSTVAPTDGQGLVWDNTASKWEPGTISSSIQTATDFELQPAAGTSPITRTGSTSTSSNVASGQIGLSIQGSGFSYWSTNPDGFSGTILDYLVNTASFPIDVDISGTTYSITGIQDNSGSGTPNVRLDHTSGISLTNGVSYTLSLTSAPTSPLADGDFLQWVNADSVFKPVQAVPAAGGTFSGDVEFDGDIAADGVYTGAVTAVAALAIDCSSSNYFTKTINANSTFTFTNVPATRAFSFTLELTHTSGTVTWPASVKFPADTAPSLTSGKTHLFMFITDDGGTTFRGASLVDYTN